MASSVSTSLASCARKWRGEVSFERMHGIEPQAVEVVVAQPHDRVVAQEAADLLAALVVEVDRVAPRRRVAMSEVRAELPEVIAGGPEMVVDDVEDHRESGGMAASTRRLSSSGVP